VFADVMYLYHCCKECARLIWSAVDCAEIGGSAGSWPASDVGDEFMSCSTEDSDFFSILPE
jgi:hypothetical protein